MVLFCSVDSVIWLVGCSIEIVLPQLTNDELLRLLFQVIRFFSSENLEGDRDKETL